MTENDINSIFQDNHILEEELNNKYNKCLKYFEKVSDKIKSYNLKYVSISIIPNVYFLFLYDNPNNNRFCISEFLTHIGNIDHKNKNLNDPTMKSYYKFIIVENWKSIVEKISKEIKKQTEKNKLSEEEIKQTTNYIFDIFNNFDKHTY